MILNPFFHIVEIGSVAHITLGGWGAQSEVGVGGNRPHIIK